MSLQAIDRHDDPAVEPRRYRVLVVDDERDFRRMMQMFLRCSGMPVDVDAVGCGADALRQVEVALPDLVLLDVMMPEMDGFEVCRRLRAADRTRHVPVLMMTALDEPSHRTHGFLVGADDYLVKPFDRAEFVAHVHRILERTYEYAEEPLAAAHAAAR